MATVFGSDAANDSLSGTSGDDTIFGGPSGGTGGGNDSLFGGEGNDTLIGGSGNDLVEGAVGNDIVSGDIGIDIVFGDAGDDQVIGGFGNDSLYGGDGNDTVGGGATSVVMTSDGADTVYGGDGNDTVVAGLGNATLFGEAGNDRLVASGWHATLYGGAGDGDLVDFSRVNTFATWTGVRGTLSGSGTTVELALNGTVFGPGDPTIIHNTLYEFEAFDASYGNDFIVGDSIGDVISGLLGRDTLYGEAGNDSLFGGVDNDFLKGGAGFDTLDGGEGDDTVDYSDLTDSVNIQLHTALADAGAQGGFDLFVSIEAAISGSGHDQIWGNGFYNHLSAGNGNDWLHGFGNEDTLYGGDGNDQLLGGTETDTLFGGNGDDYFWFDNQDAVFGGAGVDYAYNTDATAVTVNLGTASLEGVWANNGADVLDASSATWSVQLIGYGSGDTLRGGSGNDYIWFDELDTVTGGSGLDSAYATTNNGVTVNYSTQGIEQVWATNGNDRLDASGTTDGAYLIAYAGTDTVLGGAGNDYMWVDWDATDTVQGSAGHDELYQIGTGAMTLDLGARGIEVVLASNLGDILDGTSNTLRVIEIGLGGNDTLVGTTQDTDVLYGDDGNDRITGGQGNDYLYGGSGDDTFVYSSVSGGSGTDYILDFATGDKVLAGSNVAVSGMGTSTVVLSDSSTLIAFNGHNWAVGDFT